MLKLTIAKKLVLGFGLTLTLLIGLAFLSYTNNVKSAQSMEAVAGMIEDAATGGHASVDMLMARMKVKDFLIRNQPQDVHEYHSWRDKLAEATAESRANFSDHGRVERLDQIEVLFAEYDRAFGQVQTIINQRNELRFSVLDTVGPQISTAIKQAAAQLSSRGEDQAAQQLLPGLWDALEGRLAVVKFISTSDEQEYKKASALLQAAHHALTGATSAVQDPTTQNQLASATQNLARYLDALNRVHGLVVQRNTLVQGTLDRIGPEIARLQIEIQESLIHDSHAAEQETEQVIASANRTILAVSVFATLLASFAGYLIYRGTVVPLKAVIERVGEIADGDGDLTHRVDDQRHDELGELGSKVNAFISRTHDTIATVRDATLSVTAAADEIRGNAQSMATNMNRQNERAADISHAIEEMNKAVGDVARQAADASSTSIRAGEAASSGGEIVHQTITGMSTLSDAVNASASSVTELGKRSAQIGEIVAVINEIAEQTNLLALNAAIEAARAGEHGRGFAVVADEVRKLADRTTEATQEIGQSIRAIQNETSDAVQRMEVGAGQVHESVDLAHKAGSSLKLIVESTDEVAGMIHAIASATEEQSATTLQISRTVDATSAAIRDASQGAEQSFEAAAQLTRKASELHEMISRFKLAQTVDSRS